MEATAATRSVQCSSIVCINEKLLSAERHDTTRHDTTRHDTTQIKRMKGEPVKINRMRKVNLPPYEMSSQGATRSETARYEATGIDRLYRSTIKNSIGDLVKI